MNIIFFGGHYWDRGAWFRKQQFALRLSRRGHKIFYVEDAPSIIRKKVADKNLYLKTFYKEVEKNLIIITPSALFPIPSNPYTRYLYNIKLFFEIKRILQIEKIKDYVLWSNKLEISSILPKIDKIKIFDLCDDIPYYFKLANDENGYRTSMKYLKEVLKEADIPIVSAQKIKEKYKHLTQKEIIVIPNGHSINSEKSLGEIPDDISDINRPIIGFIGTLFRFIDDSLLEYIISKKPKYNYVFVGGIESNFPIQKIKQYKNVHLLGIKNKEEIKNYLNYFDICINPFRVHEVNDSVSPVKVFEYLSLKKHVISTKMYSLEKERIANYIKFASTYDEFLKLIDTIILENNFENNVPNEILNYYHWDNLFEKLINEINIKYKIGI